MFARFLLYSCLLYFEEKTVYTYRLFLVAQENISGANQDKKWFCFY